jgi:hypothetical protein
MLKAESDPIFKLNFSDVLSGANSQPPYCIRHERIHASDATHMTVSVIDIL